MSRTTCILGLLVSTLALAQDDQSPKTRTPTFSAVIRSHFSAWDTDRDGVLSWDEIEAAASNPDNKGEVAAAVATLVHLARNPKRSLPSFAEGYLTRQATHPPLDPDAQSAPSEDSDSDQPNSPNFQGIFHKYLRKIAETSRDLFPNDLPSFDAVHQSNIGDCPFVATVGALVYRNPAAVKAMFIEKEKGAAIVNFGNGHKLLIHNLTDVDIATWSSARTNGLWLTILEKAYRRELLTLEHPNPGNRTSIYTKFPSEKAFEILDGHQTEQIPLKNLKPGRQSLDSLRQRLTSVTDSKRIARAGTSGAVKIPGITPEHAYAVLGFSREDDTVEVWNPHGQNFTPHGVPGLANGYETKHGVFHVPLKDFPSVFSVLLLESKTNRAR